MGLSIPDPTPAVRRKGENVSSPEINLGIAQWANIIARMIFEAIARKCGHDDPINIERYVGILERMSFKCRWRDVEVVLRHCGSNDLDCLHFNLCVRVPLSRFESESDVFYAVAGATDDCIEFVRSPMLARRLDVMPFDRFASDQARQVCAKVNAGDAISFDELTALCAGYVLGQKDQKAKSKCQF